MQDYRRLRVFASAHDLALNVRKATNQFPSTGYASLKSQMTSAAESIAFNIAEGCGTDSPTDFARFLGIAIRSTTELEYQLELARDYEVLVREEWQPLSAGVINVRRMLWGLRVKVRASISSEAPPAAQRTKRDNA